jgi:hypothetical protein
MTETPQPARPASSSSRFVHRDDELARARPSFRYWMAAAASPLADSPVDDRGHLPCFDELGQEEHVLVALRVHEGAELLPHEPRQGKAAWRELHGVLAVVLSDRMWLDVS